MQIVAFCPPTTLLNLPTENVLMFSSCTFLFLLKIGVLYSQIKFDDDG